MRKYYFGILAFQPEWKYYFWVRKHECVFGYFLPIYKHNISQFPLNMLYSSDYNKFLYNLKANILSKSATSTSPAMSTLSLIGSQMHGIQFIFLSKRIDYCYYNFWNLVKQYFELFFKVIINSEKLVAIATKISISAIFLNPQIMSYKLSYMPNTPSFQ